MNSITEKLTLVRCGRCVAENNNNWMRIENSYPAIFIGNFMNGITGQIKPLEEPMFLCRKHAEVYIPIEDDTLELPKN